MILEGTVLGTAIVVILNWVRSEQQRRNGNGPLGKRLDEITQRIKATAEKVSELHRWHDAPDAAHPGAMLWWGMGLTETRDEIRQLREAVTELTAAVKGNE